MTNTLLQDGSLRFGLALDSAQLQAFEIYSSTLIEWNQRVNLTRIVEPAEITTKHFLDSLSVCRALANLPPDISVIDVGSGPGFPGIPLKIVCPEIHLALLEATGKKAKFLQHLVDVLALSHSTVLNARAEEAGKQAAHRERYDVAVARAVAALPVLAEYMLPFVKVGGLMVAQKGQSPVDEAHSAANALGILGGTIKEIRPVEITGLEGERHLVVIKKTKPTPRQYPRRPGLPAKKPI